MLASLHIANFALITSLDITFDTGFTVITGETGAGKSIVIGALGLLLGERSSGDVVRTGADKAVIEGVFSGDAVKRTSALLKKLEIDAQPELVVRREISAKGLSRSFINDTPAPLSALKELGDMLVDLHGQHEHQSLLRSDTHIDMLDAFAGIEKNLETYRMTFTRLNELLRELRTLRTKQAASGERTAILDFQAKDIDAVNPQPGEDDEIDRQLKRAEHAEQLFALTANVQSNLYDGEHAAHDLISQALQHLTSLTAIDSEFDKWRAEAESARVAVDEIAAFARRYHEQLEFDPVELEKQRTRLFAITGLKKKYGGSLETVIAHRAAIETERNATASFHEDLAALVTAINEERTRCADAARRLSDMRKRTCPKLERTIIASLQELGIATPAFGISITTRESSDEESSLNIGGINCQANMNGVDQVEFLISTNAGEAVKPLVKVASGGEVSRVMLALKAALAAADRTPVLVFDEIDTGISGRIAQKVGAAMRTLAGHHQLIAITHLPQIAAASKAHYVVEKKQSNGTTQTTMRRLSEEERVRAIAALMSGETITEASLKSARELMK